MNKELIIFLDKKDLKIDKQLFYNSKKERYTLLVKNKYDERFILKWNATNEEYEIHLNLLKKEIDIYLSSEHIDYIPQLIEYGENYLIIQYIEGKTLREYIEDIKGKNYDFVYNEFNDIINKINDIYLKKYIIGCNLNKNKLEFYKAIIPIMYKLALSGPNGTAPKGIRRIFLKANVRIKQYKMRKVIMNYDIYKTNNIHNDFHLNNIIVDKSRKLYIIDLENHIHGYILVDILYSFNLLKKQLNKHKNHKKVLEENFYNIFNDRKEIEFIKNINKLLYGCVRYNDKF